MSQPRIALVLGGGAARGLAHVGALGVLERERFGVDFLVGSSMGGLVGALSAAGLDAAEILASPAGSASPPGSSPAASSPGTRCSGPPCPSCPARVSTR